MTEREGLDPERIRALEESLKRLADLFNELAVSIRRTLKEHAYPLRHLSGADASAAVDEAVARAGVLVRPTSTDHRPADPDVVHRPNRTDATGPYPCCGRRPAMNTACSTIPEQVTCLGVPGGR